MITDLAWESPADNAAAREFFAQHSRGIRTFGVEVTPGVKGKYADGSDSIAGGREILKVEFGDATVRFAYPGIRWEFDGLRFVAKRDAPVQVKL